MCELTAAQAQIEISAEEMQYLKANVVELITQAQGMKATEVLPKLIERFTPDGLNLLSKTRIALWCDNISQAMDELVMDGRLISIDYVLPDMNYREKSFLLPELTQVTIHAE